MATWSDILQSMKAIDEADVVLSVSVVTENFEIKIIKNQSFSAPVADTPPVDDVEWEIYGTEQRGTVITDPPKTERQKKIDIINGHLRNAYAPSVLRDNVFLTNSDSVSDELVNRTYEQVMSNMKRAEAAAERLKREVSGDRFGKIDGV